MTTLGIILVSHSKYLARGLVDLLKEVAKDVPITYVGGTPDGDIGTSFEQIQEIVNSNSADILFAFFDLGSARMNLEMVADFADKDIRLYTVPFVEGSYTAAALIQAGADISAIDAQLKDLEIQK